MAARACPPVYPLTEGELNARWERWHVEPEQDVTVLPDPSGELIAYSRATLVTDPSRRVSMEVAVHPRHRGKGIGAALYSLIEERALNMDVPHITAPLYLAPGENRPESGGFISKRGFFPDSSYWQMRLDNISAQPRPAWPMGITFRKFRDVRSDAERWAALIRESFEEPASGPRIEAQLAEPGSSADGYFFAVDEATGLEVGTSRGRIEHVGGETVGYIGTVGVLPSYRGRKIAPALVLQTIDYLASLGLSSTILYVENNNTRARTLYERMGWRPIYRTVHYWKYLRQVRTENGS